MALTLKSDFYSPNFCSFTCTCICFWGNYISVRFFEIDIFYNEAQLLEYIYIMFQRNFKENENPSGKNACM